MWIGGTLGMVLLVGQVTVTSSPEPEVVVAPAVVCDGCGVRNKAIVDLMVLLQKAPNGETRERAARDLRRVNWHCHPEVIGALAYSLLNDRDAEVREEAAESLTRMRPNDPTAYEALSKAAVSDPNRPTRRAARRGLDALNFADRRIIGNPNGPLAMTRRLMLLPTNLIQRRVILPSGVLRQPIVVPGVTIESAPILVPETVIETPVPSNRPPQELESIPSARPDSAPFAPSEALDPKNDLAPKGEIDSKVGPPTDLAPLGEPEKVPAPPEPAPPADDVIKPLTEKNSGTKNSKTTVTRRKVASYSGRQVPVYLPR